MGLQARRQTDAIAYALLKAFNDTRAGAQLAMACKFGAFTLASGTATVSVAGMTSLSVVTLTLTAHGGTAGTRYKIVPSAGQFVVTAVDTSGSTVATDTSTFNYSAETPLYHADQTTQTMTGDFTQPAATMLSVTATNASDLPSSIALANQIRQVLNLCFADAVAHLAADTTNPVTTALAVDLTTTIALLNACKTAFNAHLTQSGVHINNDTTNNVATSNASDLPSSQTLANALKTAINAHLASAPTGESVALIAE